MTSDILKKYIDDGILALDQMENMSLHANKVSEDTLMQIVRNNKDTEYGRKYHFSEICSYEDFAKIVPLSEYSDYGPYIERMLSFGQKDLITADEVVYYAHTSGTSGASKMIPRTQKELDILFQFVFERAFGLCEKKCLEKTGRGMPLLKGINLMETRIGRTRFGTAHGAISEILNRRDDTPLYNALPQELIYPAADYDRRHVKMLFALRERHLSFFMSTFSHSIYDLFAYLADNWQALCADLEAGRIGGDIMVDPHLRQVLDVQLSPDPERAEEVRRIMAEHGEEAFIPMLWPEMRLFATVGTATFASYIERLRPALGPDIMIDNLGLVSSESTVAAARDVNEAMYLLLPFSGFYEFLPADSDEEGDGTAEGTGSGGVASGAGTAGGAASSAGAAGGAASGAGTAGGLLRIDQLETGKEYELILTNHSGFYRYRIGDVIRVEGFHNECPLIVFTHRKSQLVNMYGEKMADSVVQTAVDALAKETGIPLLEYSIYPDSEDDPGRYIILLESDRDVSPSEWPNYSERLNQLLCEAHDSYRQKIEQKIMRPLEVRFLEPQTHALYMDLKAMDGASPNQIKPVHIITEGKLKRFFFGLVDHGSGSGLVIHLSGS